MNDNEIVLYQGKDGAIELSADFSQETIWASQAQIAELFGVQRPAITRHLKNIFNDGELLENSVSSIFEHTARDGKKYNTRFYNLDAIISVGYRVNSSQATKFRIWSSNILKQYLINGAAINEKRLLQKGSESVKDLLAVVSRLSDKKILKLGEANEILSLLGKYGGAFLTLEKYDKGELEKPGEMGSPIFIMTYNFVRDTIINLRDELKKRGQATDLFGNEKDNSLDSIVSNLYQSFDGDELYKSTAEKAANLFYQVIKDHPFRDGNKRIASFLFVSFLRRNEYDRLSSGESKISAGTIVALALLVAESKPAEKESLITLLCKLLETEQ